MKSWLRLSDFTFTFHFHTLEKEMAILQYSCLENPRDSRACWAAGYGVAQSQTRLTRCSSSSSSSRKKECTGSINPSQVNYFECRDINMEDKRISFCIFSPFLLHRVSLHFAFFITSPVTWLRIWLRNICFILAEIELASRESNSIHSTHIYLFFFFFLCIRHNAGLKHDRDTFPECKNLGHWESSEAWVWDKLTLPGKTGNQNCNKELILDIPLTHFIVLCSCPLKIMTISYIGMVILITEGMLACFTSFYLYFFPLQWNKYYILTTGETKAQKSFISLIELSRLLLHFPEMQ